ncbi:hypothetical protein HD553DRAFT_36714 [Filobasidium floriforme]|uniref:uncharacterized protein n=1 Tax=Filobasidium floriforme TaxID=5210 RepID=UPI001E8CE19A|nr:uncharacterized protein HD553DRAFT_36714 [Filobasidium floriforme]KAH8084822.1 hypothetical protein HD553DRAFT_36714 [Filobasidium floriforme]
MPPPTSLASTLTSSLILSSFGLASKAFLRWGCKDVKVEGLGKLLTALEEPKLTSGSSGSETGLIDEKEGEQAGQAGRRGVVTICNHTSVVDDPMMWGIMPMNTFVPFTSPARTCRNTRWTLGGLMFLVRFGFVLVCIALSHVDGISSHDRDLVDLSEPFTRTTLGSGSASDIMFTNPIFSKFFTLGQVIETVRGGGIFQPAIDEAIKKLQAGDWVHIFPEGRVNQVSLHPPGGLIPFKWGISRIIMDSARMPTIIPIWISGFEDVMPDTRKYLRFLPRPGKRISITIGDPITDKISPLVDEWRRLARVGPGKLGVGGAWSGNERIEASLGAVKDAKTKVDLASSNPERRERASGQVADGREVSVRKQICQVLTDELTAMGMHIEAEEGKDKNPWRNAVRREGYEATSR